MTPRALFHLTKAKGGNLIDIISHNATLLNTRQGLSLAYIRIDQFILVLFYLSNILDNI